MTHKRTLILPCVVLVHFSIACAQTWQEQEIKIGVASVLSGDLAVLGKNIANTVRTYQRHYLRHNISFVFEDAKKSSLDGLRAYQSLIGIQKVDVLIGGTTSNGTLAAKELINASRTPLLTPLTGGANIDDAGPFIFRIGNSDILNGFEQAEYFITHGFEQAALYTEETEYTQDIAKFFRQRFQELGGRLVYDRTFLPDTADFRAEIAKLKAIRPAALFVCTQTGLAFGLFAKQMRQLGLPRGIEIHTNFVAASNPDAFAAGGSAVNGVHFLAPVYDKTNERLKEFFLLYESEHGAPPMIPFHTAGTVDALDMLQNYLDQAPFYDRIGFQQYLSSKIVNYEGLMGTYSLDSRGNSNLGFRAEIIDNGNPS